MRRLLIALLVIAPCVVSIPAPAFAWGPTGHRVTGALAEPLLSKKARKAVDGILGGESLAEASTWADTMRSSDDPFWRQAGPYHYVTVPVGQTYAEVGAPPQGDAVTALAQFSQTLRDPSASAEDKRRALRFAVHVVGDLHNPLHAGRADDQGGNTVKVIFELNEVRFPTNLHWVWDEGMINKRQLSYTELTAFLSRRMSAQQTQAWMDPNPQTWIAESVAIRETIYPDGADLGWKYGYRFDPVVDQRLMQGGVRIAAWLNAVFE